MTNHQPRHVFISYVRENQEQVDRLCQELENHGVNVWLDRNDIKPGARWKDTIREAIRHGDFFIACFSDEYTSKAKSYMNEELTLATEELRQFASDREWFIPVLLSECDVPARSIGAGETLLDINWVTLYEDWDAGIQKILSVIKPIPPEIQNLISALRSEDRNVRYQAVEALHKIRDPSTLPALSVALKDEDNNIRETAVGALGDIGLEAKTAVPTLIEVLKNENEGVRWRAAEALGKIGPEAKAAVSALIEALKGKDEDICGRAAEALGKIGPEAMPALIEALKDRNENVVLALGYIGPEAVPTLIEVLKNENESVRRWAAEALGYIGPEAKAAVSALSEALKNKDICWLAAVALGKIGPEALPTLTEALKSKDEDIYSAAAMALKYIGPEAVPTLIEALKNENGSLRYWAEDALEDINTPEAQKALKEYRKASD